MSTAAPLRTGRSWPGASAGRGRQWARITLLALSLSMVDGIEPLAQEVTLSARQLQAMIDEGRAIYGEKCGMCHGADLEGKTRITPTQAFAERLVPALNSAGKTWRRADPVLLAIIQHEERVMVTRVSRFLMPAFRNRLTPVDTWKILTFIKSTWTERQREKHIEANAALEKLREETQW